jgi:hypothetical protein
MQIMNWKESGIEDTVNRIVFDRSVTPAHVFGAPPRPRIDSTRWASSDA